MNGSSLHQFAAATEVLYGIRPTLTVLQALAFLHIARDEGVYQHTIQAKLETNSATSYRAVSIWKQWERPPDPARGFEGSRGEGLVEVNPDPGDLKLRMCTLTPKGRIVREQIEMRLGYGGS